VFRGGRNWAEFPSGKKTIAGTTRTSGNGPIQYHQGMIAVTSLEYALSWLDEFTAVTT
jgi:hypothetical protein